MPLSISVSAESPTPTYRQIVEQVCAAIVSGDLHENERLPTIRHLAEELALNVNTVAHAYHKLSSEGAVEGRGTQGFFVKPRRQQYSRSERRRRVEATLRAYVTDALFLGFTPGE